jgi:lipopolysaccharide/colanic/teichoic acid biosynthesis glycosyltransferase
MSVWTEYRDGAGFAPGPFDDEIGRPRADWYSSGRAAADYVAAGVLLVLTAPLLLAAMALVKLTSRGPAIYSQVRVGRDGRHFRIYKVRSMAHNCEAGTGPQWAKPKDSRVTRVGRFLRRSHLDELPQLWNVLRGEMSLVGPRPERPEFVAKLEVALPHYRERLLVRPGITGLAQVQLPPDAEVEDVGRKLLCDLYYVQHLGPRLDLQILACTAFKLVGMPFRLMRKVTKVPSLDRMGWVSEGESAEVDVLSGVQTA